MALAGIVLSIAGLWTISTWTPATTLPLLALSLLLQGIGVGLFQVAYADLVIATLPAEDRGVAGSLTILTRTIGTVGGVTALSAAFRHFEAAAASAGANAAEAFLGGLPDDLLLRRLGPRHQPRDQPAAPAHLALGIPVVRAV